MSNFCNPNWCPFATAVEMSADEDLSSLSHLFGPHIHSAVAGITGWLRETYHTQSSVSFFYFTCGKKFLGPGYLWSSTVNLPVPSDAVLEKADRRCCQEVNAVFVENNFYFASRTHFTYPSSGWQGQRDLSDVPQQQELFQPSSFFHRGSIRGLEQTSSPSPALSLLWYINFFSLVPFVFTSTRSTQSSVLPDFLWGRKPVPFASSVLAGTFTSPAHHSEVRKAKPVAARPSAGNKTAAVSGGSNAQIYSGQLYTTASRFLSFLLFATNGEFLSISVVYICSETGLVSSLRAAKASLPSSLSQPW